MNQAILIIDAHPVYIHKMEGFLKGLTFQNVILSHSGAEGLEMAKSRRPQLVILSGMLPDMDSRKVCEAVKQSCGAKVIVQVGLFTDEEGIDQLIKAGADAVLPRKEKDLAPLQRAIEEFLAADAEEIT